MDEEVNCIAFIVKNSGTRSKLGKIFKVSVAISSNFLQPENDQEYFCQHNM